MNTTSFASRLRERLSGRRLSRPPGYIVAALALALFLGLAWTPAALAATSANATIFNEVTVSYTSGSQTLSTSSSVNVTVTTLATAPTVTVDHTTDTAAAGGSVVYTYTVLSNSNGPDTYTLMAPVVSTNTGVGGPTNTASPASVTLWGGIVVGSGAGFIELPGGSLAASGLSNGKTVELTVGGTTSRFSVSGIIPGVAASSGTPEVYDQLALTLISGTAINSNVAAGEQVGEYDTVTLTQVAGVPTTLGTDGTHVTNLTFTTTATTLAGAAVTYTTSSGDSNEVTTTVTSPQLTITKASRNASTSGTFATDGSTRAKPGEIIEYQITVQNTHASATVSAVSISDTIPDYTSLVTGQYSSQDVQITTTVGGTPSVSTATAAADGDVATLGGSNLTVNIGSGATSGGGGTIAAGDSVVILFQVQVD